jgi:hypothetical protein
MSIVAERVDLPVKASESSLVPLKATTISLLLSSLTIIPSVPVTSFLTWSNMVKADYFVKKKNAYPPYENVAHGPGTHQAI